MLERPWACQVASLRDVTDQQDGDALIFGQGDEGIGARSDLTGSSGKGVRVLVSDGVDRIDDQDRGPLGAGAGQDVGQGAPGNEGQPRPVQPETTRPRRDLASGFLARGEEAGVPGTRQSRRQLEEKGRLADARRPCQEDHRAGNQATSQDSVHAWDAGADPAILGIGCKVSHGGGSPRVRGPAGNRRLSGHRAPVSAPGALPRPLRRWAAATLAHEQLLDLAHGLTIATGSDTP